MQEEKHPLENGAETSAHAPAPSHAPQHDEKVADVPPLQPPNKEPTFPALQGFKPSEKVTHEIEPAHPVQTEHVPAPPASHHEETHSQDTAGPSGSLHHTVDSHQHLNHGVQPVHPSHDFFYKPEEPHKHVAQDTHHANEVQAPKATEETPVSPSPGHVEAHLDAGNPSDSLNKSDKDSRRKKEAIEDSLSGRQPSERFKRQQEEREKREQWERENPVVPKERKPRVARSVSKGKKENLLKKRTLEERDKEDEKEKGGPASGGEHPEKKGEEEAAKGEERKEEAKSGKSPKSRPKKLEKPKEKSKRGDSRKRESSSTKKGKAEDGKDKPEARKGRSVSKSAPRKARNGKDKEDHGKDKEDKEPKGRKAVKTK